MKRELLVSLLAAAVPVWAARLSLTPLRKLLAEGPALARTIAESAEALQLGSSHDGAATEAFDALARAVTVLSFLPDGVKFCGVRIRSVHPTRRTAARVGRSEPLDKVHRVSKNGDLAMLPGVWCSVAELTNWQEAGPPLDFKPQDDLADVKVDLENS
ncbi:MAG: hypothetical protein WDO69_33705 [Pseudomonadota bacterium]